MENLEATLSQLYEKIDITIEKTWGHKDKSSFMKAMVDHAKDLFEEITAVADFSFQQLATPSVKERRLLLPYYLVNYSWANLAKSFLILWRDILFEYQKGAILTQSGQFDKTALEKLKQASYQSLKTAAEELATFLDAEAKQVRRAKGGAEKQTDKWALQQNPWPTYKAQLEQVPVQCETLFTRFQELQEVLINFQGVHQLIEQTLLSCQEELTEARQLARSNIDYIEAHFQENIRKISTHLKEQEDEIEAQNYAGDFGIVLEKKLQVLREKMQVPFQTVGGVLQFKEINFQRSTRAWLESEILPVLYEVWELSANITNNLKMSFVNIRNRILLLVNEQQEGITRAADKDTISQPLNVFLNETASWSEELQSLNELLRNRLSTDFQVSAIYNPQQAFLPVPLQSTLKQFRLNQNEVWQKVRDWVSQKLSVIQRFKVALEREEALSTSEKIVRLIESKQGDEANNQYNNIFLTKGYIGESFWVGRTSELQHMEKLIHQWKAGFRGSVLLTGRRFSGKSLFGELIANRYFAQKTIRLAPNTVIHLQGRRFTTSYDMGEALEFIQKYTINTPMLVWVDDLELWGDANYWLNHNLRQLYEYIDSYSRRLFFLVTTSQWKKAQLSLLHDVNRVFQANIQLDRMSQDEIREAILIRHGATHKVLVTEDGQEINPQQFKKMVNRTIKAARHNVGEALNLWAHSTYKIDEDHVTQSLPSNYTLPDFITPENALLLRALTIEKRMNEYRLRKQFGPAFKEKYSGILQRLISVGLLIRHLDGWLEINDLVANEIGVLLEEKKYLRDN